MISAKKRLSLMVLAILMALSLISAGITALAVTTDDTIAYPFQTGDKAFQYAPTWNGATASEDYWQFFEAKIPTTTLDSFDYLAMQLKLEGNPGLTVGALASTNNGRFDTDGANGNKFYFVSEDGTISELTAANGAINLGLNAKGMLLMPKTSLVWRWNTDTSIKSLYFTTNAFYNRDFKVTVGEIGYYKGEPKEGNFTELLDLSLGCKESNYYVDNATKTPVDYPVYRADAYPFRVGEDAFANAPTWVGQTTQAETDSYQFVQPKFTETDFTNVDYLAIQIKVVKGNPGMTVGAISSTNGRYGTFANKENAVKLVKADGTVKNLNILYSSVTLSEGDEGMLLIPLDNLSWVSWAEEETRTIDKMASVYFETNAKYNWNFKMTIGEIGYYVGEPGQNGSIYTELFDLDNGEQKTNYYIAASTLEFPSDDPNAVPETVEYPFLKGSNAFEKAVVWAGTATGDSAANWQTFSLKFDSEADLTDATWLVVQYKAMTGTPGITYGVQNGGARYSIAGFDGTKSYMIDENGTVTVASQYQYDASNVSGSGALLINFNKMAWQFGEDADKDLTKIKQLILTTNSQYNWNFEIAIGEVGYYTGTLGEDAVYHKLVDTSKTNKLSQATATSDKAENCCAVRAYKVDRLVYGDVTLNWLATGKSAGSFAVWDGGSYGKVEMVTDSYGDDAAKLTSTGANPEGDQYTATTIADGIKWDWSGSKGVTFWARNDSDVEVSFNLEIDICNNGYTNNAKGHNARYNIKQGNRFILYDVNTEKQTIYMTRPCATLPVGFEGWVFIPFTAFYQADWSTSSQGAMLRSLFIDENNTFTSGSWASYVAITAHAPTYQGKSFSFNKLGSYKVTPSFISACNNETSTAKSVPTVMDLPKEEN